MSRRTGVRSALLVAVAALALSACSASDPSTTTTQGAIPAELQFTSTTLDGQPFDGASLYGEATILWFWAPWCPSCAADSKEVLAAIPELPDGVQIIGVPTTSDEASMVQFAADFGVGDLTNVIDEDGSIWSGFGVPQLPSSAVIYPDGFIATLPGSLTKEQILDIAAKIAP